jgi:hypothetical protein
MMGRKGGEGTSFPAVSTTTSTGSSTLRTGSVPPAAAPWPAVSMSTLEIKGKFWQKDSDKLAENFSGLLLSKW